MDWRVEALVALNRPLETINQALQQRWALADPGQRRVTELDDLSRVDLATGRFDRARQRLAELGRVLVADPDGSRHDRRLGRLVELLLETSQAQTAARVAEQYLASNQVLSNDEETSWQTRPRMWWAMHRGNRLGADGLRARIAGWLREQKTHPRLGTSPGWPLIAAFDVETEAEAREALATLPIRGDPPDTLGPISAAALGRLYVLTGRSSEAFPYLRSAAATCRVFFDTRQLMLANYYLGRAFEDVGHPAQACAAYAVVLGRWGNARPPSRAAAAARLRHQALHCDPVRSADRVLLNVSGTSDG
jgi:hypothetical protein